MSLSSRAGLIDGTVILIVDTDDDDARLIQLMLMEVFGAGVAVSRAHTQTDALDFLAAEPAACVLLDLGLTGIGDETLALLVSTAPQAAIVVLTAEEDASAGIAAVAAGAQDYLVKGRSSAEAVGRAVRHALVRKRTELRVATAASHLAAVVNSSADAIFSKTLDGVIISWSAGSERMFGYNASEMIGTSVAKLFPVDRADTLPALLARIRRGARIEGLETQRVRKDGTVLDVWSSISPMHDASGEVVGASTVCRDMSEHKRIETGRRDHENQLHKSERLESLGHLAGGIVHDFANLLVIILNYAEFLEAETVDMPQARADAQQIQVAARSAAELTSQLLLFANREHVVPTELDLRTVVEDIRTMLSRTIGPDIAVVVNSASTLPLILADRSQIEQVIMNLAVNARDAMHGGGTLTIDTRATDLDEVFARLHPGLQSGRFVELVVTDTGEGMSADIVKDIFKPFFTTKPVGRGTGLGLATVYRIVDEAHGTIAVDSQPGVATSFHLYFPAIPAAAA